MVFVRVKKVKGHEYAYLVKNTWKKKASSRQVVKKYLGKVLEIPHVPKEFVVDVNFLNFEESVRSVVKWQLGCFGFEKKGNQYVKEDLVFSLSRLSLKNAKTGRPAVIRAAEGYFCQWALKKLLSFSVDEEEEEAVGYNLARAFVEAGIHIPKEVFIKIYEKVQ